MDQSKKSVMRSEGQKQEQARQGYDPVPPASPVAGAFGEHKHETPTDQDIALEKARMEKAKADV